MNFKKTTLPNGLRIITVMTKDHPSVTVLVVVETGSNYETRKENGLSHFLEHVCFKGTINRPNASDIARELDSLGAQNNAFTSNELTGYYAKAARKHFSKLFDIISDLYLNPTLPASDIEKERGVVLEELNMYEDLPERKVWYVLAKLMYGDVPAGRSVIGPKENLRAFTRDDFVKYRNKHYVASSTVMFVAGDVDHKTVVAEVQKNFKNVSKEKKVSKLSVRDKQKSPNILIHKKKTDQTHLVMAFRAFAANDKRTPALTLLAEILGRGMSSRLFHKLRDEMGVCYYVRAENITYTDHGYFAISSGINVKRTKEVVKTLLEECKKLTEIPVSAEELKKAKEHFSGNLYMNLETTDSLAEFYALQEVSTGKLKNPKEISDEIKQVTAKDIMKVAREVFRNNRLNLAVVGNVANEREIKKTLLFK